MLKGKNDKDKMKNVDEPEVEKQKEDKKDSEPENSNEKVTDEKIAELEEQLKELQDKYLRKVAEFENYKRRVENDQFNLITYGAESFIVKLLPVVDDFERSLQHIDSAKDSEAIKQGVKLVYEKLMKALDDQGVKKMQSVGKPFDVDYHDALMQRKDDSVEPHTILEEIESGYIYRDKVIRHAKVIVSEDISESDTSANGSDSGSEENKQES